MDTNRQNQIESYLSGQMSPEEASSFESMLEVNPELREELGFQSDVINGIGKYRKAELKARLDAIDVRSGWWTVSQLAPVGQFIGGAAIVSLVGVGGYLAFDAGSEPRGADIIIDAPDYLRTPVSFDLFLESLEQLDEDVKVEPTIPEPTHQRVVVTEEEKAEALEFVPIVAVPEVEDVADEVTFEPESLPEPDQLDDTAEKSETIDVEVVDSKTSRIKYRYYAGKLYLYGKFQDEPYQILEINSSTGRKIFLYHLSTFYNIRQSDKPLQLEPITDKALIQELSILRKSK